MLWSILATSQREKSCTFRSMGRVARADDYKRLCVTLGRKPTDAFLALLTAGDQESAAKYLGISLRAFKARLASGNARLAAAGRCQILPVTMRQLMIQIDRRIPEAENTLSLTAA